MTTPPAFLALLEKSARVLRLCGHGDGVKVIGCLETAAAAAESLTRASSEWHVFSRAALATFATALVELYLGPSCPRELDAAIVDTWVVGKFGSGIGGWRLIGVVLRAWNVLQSGGLMGRSGGKGEEVLRWTKMVIGSTECLARVLEDIVGDVETGDVDVGRVVRELISMVEVIAHGTAGNAPRFATSSVFFRRLGRSLLALPLLCKSYPDSVIKVVVEVFRQSMARHASNFRRDLLPSLCLGLCATNQTHDILWEALWSGSMEEEVFRVVLQSGTFRWEGEGRKSGMGWKRNVLHSCLGPSTSRGRGSVRRLLQRVLPRLQVPLWALRSALEWVLGNYDEEGMYQKRYTSWAHVMELVPIHDWVLMWSGRREEHMKSIASHPPSTSLSTSPSPFAPVSASVTSLRPTEATNTLTVLLLLFFQLPLAAAEKVDDPTAPESQLLLDVVDGVQAKLGAHSPWLRFAAMRVAEAATAVFAPSHPLRFDQIHHGSKESGDEEVEEEGGDDGLHEPHTTLSLWEAVEATTSGYPLPGVPLPPSTSTTFLGLDDTDVEDDDGDENGEGEVVVGSGGIVDEKEEGGGGMKVEERLRKLWVVDEEEKEEMDEKVMQGMGSVEVVELLGLGGMPRLVQCGGAEAAALWGQALDLCGGNGSGLAAMLMVDGGGKEVGKIEGGKGDVVNVEDEDVEWKLPCFRFAPSEAVVSCTMADVLAGGEGSGDGDDGFGVIVGRKKPPVYIRDALDGLLGEEDAQRWESCLEYVGLLMKSSMEHPSTRDDAIAIAPTVLQRMLSLRNHFAHSQFEPWRQRAAQAATEANPLSCGAILIAFIFHREKSHAQRTLSLSILVAAARSMAGLGDSDATSPSSPSSPSLRTTATSLHLPAVISELDETTTLEVASTTSSHSTPMGESGGKVVVRGVERARTRRWGRGRVTRKVLGPNKAAPHAARWCKSLLTKIRSIWERSRTKPDVLGGGEEMGVVGSDVSWLFESESGSVLAMLLRGLCVLLLCARGSPELAQLAAGILELVAITHKHPHADIRAASLAAVGWVGQIVAAAGPAIATAPSPARTLTLLLPSSTQSNLAALLTAAREWLVDAATNDPDKTCRDQANVGLASNALAYLAAHSA